MDARELRIGNLVLIDNEVIEIASINQFGVNVRCESSYYGACSEEAKGLFIKSYSNEKEVFPIPLTENWLEKFGFIYDIHQLGVEYMRDDNNFTVFYHPEFADEVPSPFGRSFGKGFDIYFKYVHHLQNVYYALTGTELTIKQ